MWVIVSELSTSLFVLRSPQGNMLFKSLVFALSTALGSLTAVSGLGSSCSAPLGAGTAAAGAPYWMQNIAHQGIAPFNPSPSSYQVFRNVKNFGAKVCNIFVLCDQSPRLILELQGDGVTDDTAAIK